MRLTAILRMALIAICAGTLLGCGEPVAQGRIVPGASITPATIKSLYVYSFLQGSISTNNDMREGLQKFDQMFVDALRSRNMTVTYMDATTLSAYANEQISTPSRTSALRGTSREVSVGNTIRSNGVAEQASGASHRLVLFPSQASSVRQGMFVVEHTSRIRWEILSIAANSVLAEGTLDLLFFNTAGTSELRPYIRDLVAEFERLHIVQPASR